jgi:hypothetical protein
LIFDVKIFDLDDKDLDDHDPVPFFDKTRWINLDKNLFIQDAVKNLATDYNPIVIKITEMSIGNSFQPDNTFCIWGYMRDNKSISNLWKFVKVELRPPVT